MQDIVVFYSFILWRDLWPILPSNLIQIKWNTWSNVSNISVTILNSWKITARRCGYSSRYASWLIARVSDKILRRGKQTAPLSIHTERKCADTIGTVPVPWAGHFQRKNINTFSKWNIRKQFYQTALRNCYRFIRLKLPTCWSQFKRKNFVSFIIIFFPLSYPISTYCFIIRASMKLGIRLPS